MPLIGMAVLKETRSIGNRIIDFLRHQDRTNRLISGPQSLGDGLQITRNAFLFNRMQGAGAAHTAHDLVKDQKHTILIANLADTFEITRHRGQGTRCCADNRLGDKGGNAVGPQFKDRGFKFVGDPQTIRRVTFARHLVTIRITGRDMACRNQQRLELFATPHIAANRKRAQRIAMIGLAARNHVFPVRLPDLKEILPRHFKRRLCRLGPARNEIRLCHAFGGMGYKVLGQFFHRIGGKETRMGIGNLINLGMHGGTHRRVGMPKA